MYNGQFFAIDMNFIDRDKSLKENLVVLNITPFLSGMNENDQDEKISSI